MGGQQDVLVEVLSRDWNLNGLIEGLDSAVSSGAREGKAHTAALCYAGSSQTRQPLHPIPTEASEALLARVLETLTVHAPLSPNLAASTFCSSAPYCLCWLQL